MAIKQTLQTLKAKEDRTIAIIASRQTGFYHFMRDGIELAHVCDCDDDASDMIEIIELRNPLSRVICVFSDEAGS